MIAFATCARSSRRPPRRRRAGRGRPGRRRSSGSSSCADACRPRRGWRPGSRRSSGVEAEVGQLVVEIIAVDHQPRAEAAFDRRGFRSDIAPAVDRDEVGGAVLLQETALAQSPGAPAGVPASATAIVAVRSKSAPSGSRDRSGRSARRPARGRSPGRRDIGRGRRKRGASIPRSGASAVGDCGPSADRSNRSSCFRICEHGGPARRDGPMPQMR